METGVDLNTLNVDDLYVNRVRYLNNEDITEDHDILVKDDDGAYII